MQYLGTQGNGKVASGRFVTNDGVHVYRAWGVFHGEVSANTVLGTGYHRATAAEALTKAKAEIALRGLVVTVTKDYYGLVVAQRKYATAQLALDEAKRFLDISQDLESSGQASHSDALKAQILYEQQEQAFEEAGLAMEDSRLTLAVLIFPALNENFTVVSDLDTAPALPPFPEVQVMAAKENPDIRVALEAQREADLDVSTAKTAFWPTLVVDTDYGIEANAFALNSTAAAFPELGKLPNLGYFITASLNLPVWDWGAMRSKLRQAEDKREQARVEVSQTQREVLSNLFTAYNEAAVARNAVDRLRRTADLAAESLRLIQLRYQAGESPALELVDAANSATSTRNAYDDALARYRVALATLQTLTGTF
jgi:outer membrane protein